MNRLVVGSLATVLAATTLAACAEEPTAAGGGDADGRAWAEYEQTLRADGVLSSSGHFAEPSDAGVIVTAISRHPDAEPQPTAALSGYYLLEVADRTAAEEYARRAPLYGTVEVRPLVEH